MKPVDFKAERYNGNSIIYPETDLAQEWADEHGEEDCIGGGVSADGTLLQALQDEGFVIEGLNDNE